MAMIGQTISHYKVLEKIGEGGMGEVYLAEDTDLNRRVALKFLPAWVDADAATLERFRREAAAAAALHHPNIITIHEIAAHDGRPYIVMAYVDGELLSKTIARGDLSLPRALEIAKQIAEALAAAHEVGIVHRDVKPDNVVIDRRGNVNLLDFGLAKLRGAESVTREHSTVGTAHYMSPEQTRGADVDARSDIFSFGALLYELITGQRAFRGEHREAVAYAIVGESPQPIFRYTDDATDTLQRLIDKLLEKDPEKRYQSMRDAIVDLSAAQLDLEDVRSPNPRPRAGAASVGKWLIMPVAIAFMALVVWTISQREGEPVPEPMQRAMTESDEATEIVRKPKIVVLPFENLGAPEDEYFADGMTEEITSRLVNVHDLAIVSRTSAVEYDREGKTMKQIGADLGADYVIEGTVRWAHGKDGTERVRITPQLIRVSDDTHLWADRYDRVIDDIFDVQSDIAVNVVDAMSVNLLEPERRAISARPTGSVEAYNAYLRGREKRLLLTAEAIGEAIGLFEHAVRIDPTFVQAWCALARAHASAVHFGYETGVDSDAAAQLAAERALELAPDSPDAHIAMGYFHYHAHKDYAKAEAEFAIAAESRPDDMVLLRGRGLVQRRQNQWDESTRSFKHALDLDPMAADIMFDLADNYTQTRRYAKADSLLARAIELRPDFTLAFIYRWLVAWLWTGDGVQARAFLDQAPDDASASIPIDFFYYRQCLYEGDYGCALSHIRRMKNESVSFGPVEISRELLIGVALRGMGDTDGARDAFERARVHLEREYARTGAGRFHPTLAVVYGALGRADDAHREIAAAREWMPLEKDWTWGPDLLRELAWAYVETGEGERALDLLEQLMSINVYLSANVLRVEPYWQPLHNNPRFEKLIGGKP